MIAAAAAGDHRPMAAKKIPKPKKPDYGQPKTPKLTVDAVLLDTRGMVALIRRGNPPYQGRWALPGGFVDPGESVEDAILREVREEAGVRASIASLVGVYSDPKRDPRFHSVTVAFLCRKGSGRMAAGDDAAEIGWFEAEAALRMPLAFDHRKVLRDALLVDRDRARKRRRGRPRKSARK